MTSKKTYQLKKVSLETYGKEISQNYMIASSTVFLLAT